MSKSRVSFSTYPQDFYSGSQCRIYFGSIFVDDLATIQYQSSHSKTPLYGYADHQFRTVAKGQFLVRGSFTLAFKETGYLYSLIKLVNADKTNIDLTGKKNSLGTYLNYLGSGLTVEQALDYTASKKTTSKAATDDFKKDADFEDIAEVLEDAIWGKPDTPATFSARIPRSDELDYNKHTGGAGSSSDIDINGFDILLTFGNYRTGSDSLEHTMVSLNDVHITGESMILSTSAEPIGLTCEFFARGLNEKVSNSWDSDMYASIKKANDKIARDIDTKSKTAEKTADKPINTAGLIVSANKLIDILLAQIQDYFSNRASSAATKTIAELALSSIESNIDTVKNSNTTSIKSNIRILWSELRDSLSGNDTIFTDKTIFNALKELEKLSK